MKIALIALAGLAAAFALTPVDNRPAHVEGVLFKPAEPKSGLQYAIEGRLRWLGVL
jgi:uncharacterized protein (DUF2126 family)